MKKLLAIALLSLLPFYALAEEAKTDAPAQESAIVVAAPTPPPPATRLWEMDAAESSITFHGKQMGKDFNGSILQFTPQIYFDPAQLDQSKVTVELDLQTIEAGDSERNKNLLSPDWLNILEFPTARFETASIKKTDASTYIADATLTIHGMIQELEFPFTIDFAGEGKGKYSGKDKAVMTGAVTLDRSKFQLGQGDWADPSVIANEIPVEVKVTAYSAKPQ